MSQSTVIYAAQWQDPYEPWGWETDSVYRRREDAQARVDDLINEQAAGEVSSSESRRAYQLERYEKEMDEFDPDAPFIGVYVSRPHDPSPKRQPPTPPAPATTIEQAREWAAQYCRVEEFELR